MRINPISTINFGYSHPLKTLYKKGLIPLKNDFYGSPMTPKNVTIEHLKCAMHGGATELKNIVLATSANNSSRGNKPLREVINFKAMGEYFEVFRDKVFDTIDGNEYIRECMKTIAWLLKNE